MRKLFSKMGIVLTNQCNQRCSWCFEGEWKRENKQEMTLEDIERLLHWKKWDDGHVPVVYLLGGEPTLHPRLLEIVDLIHEFNPKMSVFLLTNLTCSQQLLKELVARKVVIFANIDQFEPDNNVANQSKILDNLEYLNKETPEGYQYNISATVSTPDKDFEFLYRILQNGKNKIYNLRLAPSCIGFECRNQFQKNSGNEYYEKVLQVLERCLEIKPNLHLSTECATNGCMISDELYNKLYRMGYKLRFECGLPEPNADILPDLSCHWCFAFEKVPELKIDNVLEFSDDINLLDEMYRRYKEFNERNQYYCDPSACDHSECKGGCAALNYYAYKQIEEVNR
ncbi:MAG TPA: hypothetical protein DCE48_01925 [Lachnospiraceae bacterium]|nr:hypothetical protein [Lachnospiraceae bacterium]